MIPPVLIEFAVGGMQSVERAFSSVESRMARMERNSTQEQERGSRQRVRGSQEEADKREKVYGKLFDQIDRKEAKAVKDAERAADQKTKALAREAKKQADADISEAERSRKAQEREAERLEQYKMRLRIRSSEAAGRLAVREANEQEAASARLHRGLGRGGVRAMSGVGGMLSGAAALAGSALTIGGGFALADVARNSINASATGSLIRNIVVAGNGGVAPEGSSVANIVGKASQASRESGMSRDEIMSGALAYAQNARGGDLKGVLGNMSFFAKLSKVTGTSMADLGEAAGTLMTQNNGQLSNEGLQKMLLAANAQAAAGSMSLVDAAKQFGTLGSTRAFYKGDAATNQQTLIGLGQIARAAGDKDEAGTFVKDIATEAGAANRKFKKETGKNLLNIDPVTGQLDDPEKVIEQVFRSTKGNINTIGHVFGQRGSRLFTELAGTYQGASAAAGGGDKGVDAGIAAVMKNVRGVTGQQGSAEDLDKRLAEMMDEPGERFKHALNDLSLNLEDKVTPWLPKLADGLEKLIPLAEQFATRVEHMVEYFSNNPFDGLATVIGGALALEMGRAAIPTLMEKALTTRLGGEIAVAAATIALGTAIINIAAEAEVHRQKEVVADSNEEVNTAGQLNAQVRAGKVDPATLAKAQASAEAAKAEIAKRRPDEGTFIDPNGEVFGRGAEDPQTTAEIKNFQLGLTALTDAIKKAKESVGSVASNTSPANPANWVAIDRRPNP